MFCRGYKYSSNASYTEPYSHCCYGDSPGYLNSGDWLLTVSYKYKQTKGFIKVNKETEEETYRIVIYFALDRTEVIDKSTKNTRYVGKKMNKMWDKALNK